MLLEIVEGKGQLNVVQEYQEVLLNITWYFSSVSSVSPFFLACQVFFFQQLLSPCQVFFTWFADILFYMQAGSLSSLFSNSEFMHSSQIPFMV